MLATPTLKWPFGAISPRHLLCNFYLQIAVLFLFSTYTIYLLVYFIFHVLCICISVCILCVLLCCHFGIIKEQIQARSPPNASNDNFRVLLNHNFFKGRRPSRRQTNSVKALHRQLWGMYCKTLNICMLFLALQTGNNKRQPNQKIVPVTAFIILHIAVFRISAMYTAVMRVGCHISDEPVLGSLNYSMFPV